MSRFLVLALFEIIVTLLSLLRIRISGFESVKSIFNNNFSHLIACVPWLRCPVCLVGYSLKSIESSLIFVSVVCVVVIIVFVIVIVVIIVVVIIVVAIIVVVVVVVVIVVVGVVVAFVSHKLCQR